LAKQPANAQKSSCVKHALKISKDVSKEATYQKANLQNNPAEDALAPHKDLLPVSQRSAIELLTNGWGADLFAPFCMIIKYLNTGLANAAQISVWV